MIGVYFSGSGNSQYACEQFITFVHRETCTLCYRCANYCPQKAITILGKHVIAQTKINDYDQPIMK